MVQQGAMRQLPPVARGAALVWLLAAVLWFALEAVAAAAFRPPYSYARNYISDLGVPTPGTFQGRPIDSPRAALMNTNFYAQALLFALAALLIYRATAGRPGRARHAFLALALTYAVGNALVATFHGAAQNVADGTAPLHVIGAGLAILGGNAAAIVAGVGARRLGAPRGYRVASVTLGTVGLLAVIVLQAGDPFGVPGIWERAAVYTIPAWEIVTGVAILRATRARAGETS